jgi:hypothetical protein
MYNFAGGILSLLFRLKVDLSSQLPYIILDIFKVSKLRRMSQMEIGNSYAILVGKPGYTG